MANFSTKGAKVDSGLKPGKFIGLGPNELKVVKLEKVLSKAGDKFKVVMHLESKPVTEEGFEGHEGALGKIGKVDLSIFTTGSDLYIHDALGRIATIGETLGVRDELDSIAADKIDDYLAKVTQVFKNKYAWYLIGGEEFMGKDEDDKPKVKFFIKLPQFSFVAPTEDALLGKMKGKVWPTKEGTPWFFKKLVQMDKDTTVQDDFNAQGKPINDLPFDVF